MKARNCPWYREPWPWLIMSGPAVVVVAGIFTTVLAVRSSDGLVADDYYKEGLTINRLLERDARAQAAGIRAQVRFGAGGMVRVSLPATLAPAPAGLRLQVQHPTRAGLDQEVSLRPLGAGLWEGRMTPAAAGRWRLQLDAADAGWRITGEWRSGEDSADLSPPAPEPRP